MKPLGSIAAVVAAIHDEAGIEVDGIERDAAAQLESLQASDAGADAAPDRDARIAAARRQGRERLLREDWQDARAALEARERWIAAAVAEGARLLAMPQSPEATRALLRRLASEAFRLLPGRKFDLVVRPSDARLLDEAFRGSFGDAEVRIVEGPIGGGCIVRTEDGGMSVDNTFAARGEKLKTVWRAALGRLYG